MPSDLHYLFMGDDKIFLDIQTHIDRLLFEQPLLSDNQVRETIEHQVFKQGEHLTLHDKKQWIHHIFNKFRGLDLLQTLVDDPAITEIMVNRFDQIFIESNGQMKQTDLRFENEQKLSDLIQFIVSDVNRTVNEAHPIVDSRWKEKIRVNVVLPPIAIDGPALTMRKFPESMFSLDDLVRTEFISSEAAEFLGRLVASRYNILIGGGTNSGKTTFLNALTNLIPAEERLITIEDSAELKIKSPDNVVRLETRNPNVEGRGQISMSDLIRTALRMRPTRIIVGEVRGKEAFDMLQAMNTGHDGSMSTAHANGAFDMLSRLETMVISAVDIPLQAVRSMICSAIEIIVHVAYIKGKRRVMQISEIAGLNNHQFLVHDLFVTHPTQGLIKTDQTIVNQTKWLRYANE